MRPVPGLPTVLLRTVAVAVLALSAACTRTRGLVAGSVLVVTTGLMMDRTGRPYGVRIEPDTAAPDEPETPSDETLGAALEWLANGQ